MSTPKLHPDEVDIDESLVRRLVANQFPRWRDLPISRVRSDSTDNALYRLGDDMVVRFPRLPRAVGQIRCGSTPPRRGYFGPGPSLRRHGWFGFCQMETPESLSLVNSARSHPA